MRLMRHQRVNHLTDRLAVGRSRQRWHIFIAGVGVGEEHRAFANFAFVADQNVCGFEIAVRAVVGRIQIHQAFEHFQQQDFQLR